ncbi:integral membrane protein [Fusarium oxysporum f. sp. phaseoli]
MNSTDSSTVGAYPPPPGAVPNFTNPESIASRVVLAAALSPVFTIPIVLLRLYTSRFIIKCWHLDDCRSPSSKGTKGLLTHFNRFMMLGAIPGAITYNLSTLFTKVSILHFYLRFSQDRAFKLATYFVMFVVVGNNLPAAFAFLYMCRPITRYWDYTRPGSCLDVGSAFIVCAVLNSVTDIIILCLPIWLLRPLRMRRLQKIGVTLVLMAGGLADVWQRVRRESYQVGVYSIWTSQPRRHVAICHQFNLVVNIVEMYAGIICACLPCLRAFFKRFFPDLFVVRHNTEARLSTIPSFVHHPQQPGEPHVSTNRRLWWSRSTLSKATSHTSSMEACHPNSVPLIETELHGPEKARLRDRAEEEGFP